MFLRNSLWPGRVDDDVLPFLRVKPNLRGVDRDVLVALGLQRVHQVRPLERHAAALGDFLQLLQFAFRQRAGVVQQAAHKRGLAVVHVADDDDLQLPRWKRSSGCASVAAEHLRQRLSRLLMVVESWSGARSYLQVRTCDARSTFHM